MDVDRPSSLLRFYRNRNRHLHDEAKKVSLHSETSHIVNVAHLQKPARGPFRHPKRHRGIYGTSPPVRPPSTHTHTYTMG